jgi:hypothetical protein
MDNSRSNNLCEGVRYRIKNLNSQNVINSWGYETGAGTLTMAYDDNPSFNHRIWVLVQSEN